MSARSAFRSDGRRRLLLGVVLAGVAAAVPAQAQGLSTPSLWANRGSSLVNDVRARQAGDILTILIDEQSSAEKKAETDLKKDTDFSGRLTPPHFDKPGWLRDILVNVAAAGTGKSDFDGQGTTNRTDRATGILTARVMRVLDNGNLVVEGRRLVTVNAESQTIVVSGVVRPFDIGWDNTIRSSQIADGEIRMEGRGTLSDRQRPGFWQRMFDWLGF